MSDLVERLKKLAESTAWHDDCADHARLMREAADEIERLREENFALVFPDASEDRLDEAVAAIRSLTKDDQT